MTPGSRDRERRRRMENRWEVEKLWALVPKKIAFRMRILDEVTDKRIDRLTIYLLESEASELRDSLDALLERARANRSLSGDHEHVPSLDFEDEVTVCLYDPENLELLNERSRRLIREGS